MFTITRLRGFALLAAIVSGGGAHAQTSAGANPCEALLGKVEQAREQFAHDERGADQKAKALQIELNESTRKALSPIGLSILSQAKVPTNEDSQAAFAALASPPLAPGLSGWEGEWQKQVAVFTKALGLLEIPAFQAQLAKGGFVDLGDLKLGTYGYLQIHSGLAGYARARMEMLAQSLNRYCDAKDKSSAKPTSPSVDSGLPPPPASTSGAAE